MKQASIHTFFKRSATTTDELLRPAKKKLKADDDDDTPSSSTSMTKPSSIVDDEDVVATPPIPQSPPSPAHNDNSGEDTEEDEDAQQFAQSSRRTQSMPAHTLKAAIRKYSTDDSEDEDDIQRDNDSDEEEKLQGKTNGNSNGLKLNNAPKVDKSRSKLIMEHAIGNQVIQIRQGDITEECTGAIVNAANSSLAHGGGVAGAISRKGGPQIQSESTKWVRAHGTVPAGKVAVTGPGRLPCDAVIHAVGPIWAGGKRGEDKELYGAVWNSLLKAHQLNLPSIAIPAISSGIFGFPKDRCAYIMTECAVKFCAKFDQSPLKQIRFTNFDNETVGIFTDEFQNRFGSEDNKETDENGRNKSDEGDDSDDNSNHTTTTTNTTISNNTKKSLNKSGEDTEEDESLQPTKNELASDNEDESTNTTSSKQPTSSSSSLNLKFDGDDSDSDDAGWGKWKR